MTLAVIISFLFGLQTGQIVTKRELTKDKAYFCRIEDNIKRCYEVKEDPLAREYLPKRTN